MAANVYHLDLYGTRAEKYEWLRTHSLADIFPRRQTPKNGFCQNDHCRACCRRRGDVFAGKRRVRLVTTGKKKRQKKRQKKRYLPLPPALSPWVFGPLPLGLFPEAVPVPVGLYQGLCRIILQIERMLGLAHCANASLAVQVADTLHEDAAQQWISDHPDEFRRGCGQGFREPV